MNYNHKVHTYKGHDYHVHQDAKGKWLAAFTSMPRWGYECTLYRDEYEENPEARNSESACHKDFRRWIDFCDRMIAWRKNRPSGRLRGGRHDHEH